jgi:hypothetical protein
VMSHAMVNRVRTFWARKLLACLSTWSNFEMDYTPSNIILEQQSFYGTRTRPPAVKRARRPFKPHIFYEHFIFEFRRKPQSHFCSRILWYEKQRHRTSKRVHPTRN